MLPLPVLPTKLGLGRSSFFFFTASSALPLREEELTACAPMFGAEGFHHIGTHTLSFSCVFPASQILHTLSQGLGRPAFQPCCRSNGMEAHACHALPCLPLPCPAPVLPAQVKFPLLLSFLPFLASCCLHLPLEVCFQKCGGWGSQVRHDAAGRQRQRNVLPSKSSKANIHTFTNYI